MSSFLCDDDHSILELGPCRFLLLSRTRWLLEVFVVDFISVVGNFGCCAESALDPLDVETWLGAPSSNRVGRDRY